MFLLLRWSPGPLVLWSLGPLVPWSFGPGLRVLDSVLSRQDAAMVIWESPGHEALYQTFCAPDGKI